MKTSKQKHSSSSHKQKGHKKSDKTTTINTDEQENTNNNIKNSDKDEPDCNLSKSVSRAASKENLADIENDYHEIGGKESEESDPRMNRKR